MIINHSVIQVILNWILNSYLIIRHTHRHRSFFLLCFFFIFQFFRDGRPSECVKNNAINILKQDDEHPFSFQTKKQS